MVTTYVSKTIYFLDMDPAGPRHLLLQGVPRNLRLFESGPLQNTVPGGSPQSVRAALFERIGEKRYEKHY